MKRVYELLPKDLVKKIRNVVEFRGGVVDTALFKSNPNPTRWDKRGEFRFPPASQPAPKLPTRDAFKIYDIKQYSRDTRGGHPTAATHTMLDEIKSNPRQAGNVLQPVLPDTLGNPSPGRVDPDVARYSVDGLRSAMTASTGALVKEQLRNQPNHLPGPAWADRAGEILAAAKKAGVPAPPGVRRTYAKDPFQHVGRYENV